ncbi:MAG: type II toxin-antitoxin system VapC family toxin [Promethearchaeota archaeon]
MVKAICLDTRIISHFLKGKKSAMDIINEYIEQGFEIYTTVVNITEYFLGLYKSNIVSDIKLKELENFFSTLHPRSLDYNAGLLAGKIVATILKGQEIGWRDTFIGAIVLLNGRMIITNNLKHFKRIPELEVIEY